LAALGYEPYFTTWYEAHRGAEETGGEEMTKEEIEEVGAQCEYDGSRLTSEQR